ncbi:MAG TPA: nitrogen fixation protein NifX [Geobacteraceae bacterium]|nr:nitrogen fixation protein NifX [Geobacteraceae bacterium]
MKVAFTSSNGEMIDQHFGMTESFSIWEVAPHEAYVVETVSVKKHDGDEEDKIAARVALLKECAIVYTMQIGGPAAAKLVATKIQPMKTNTEVPIAEIVAKLQGVLQGNPPPWLRKAMHKGKPLAFLEEEE